MSKKQRLWLARGRGGRDVWYSIGTCRPKFDTDGLPEFFPAGGKLVTRLYDEDFEQMAGIRLAPGEVREVAAIVFKLIPKRKGKRCT
jgi:hypothetical protein